MKRLLFSLGIVIRKEAFSSSEIESNISPFFNNKTLSSTAFWMVPPKKESFFSLLELHPIIIRQKIEDNASESRILLTKLGGYKLII